MPQDLLAQQPKDLLAGHDLLPGSSASPPTDPNILGKNMFGEPVKKIDLSPKNIGNAAIGGLKDAAIETIPMLAMEGASKVVTPAIRGVISKIDQTKIPSQLRQIADRVGLEIKGKTPQEVQQSIEKYFETARTKVKDFLSPDKKDFNPVEANRQISKAYKAEMEHSKNLYAAVRAGFRNTKIKDTGLTNDLNELITELKSTPSVGPDRTDSGVTVKDLENIQQRLTTEPIKESKVIKAEEAMTVGHGELDYVPGKGITHTVQKGHNLNVNDLIDLKQTLNQHYNPKVFRSSSDAPYARLSSKIDKLIMEAGRKNPQAYKAYEAANHHYTNDVARRFTDNKVLEQFWKPEDLHNSFDIDKGVHPNTALRVESFMKKINSPIDLEVVANSVDPQYAKVIYANKFADLAKEIGMDGTKVTPEKIALLEKSLGKGYGAVQSRKVLNDMREVLELLKQRNIKAPYTEAELMRQSKTIAQRLGNLWHSIAAMKSGNPMSMIKNAGDALTKEEQAKAAAEKMDALLKEYNKRVKP